MTIDNKEYALFSYQPLEGRKPSMTPWIPKQRVCFFQNNKYKLDYEFFDWISNVCFPYKIYEDHTPSLTLPPYTKRNVIPQKLQFKETSLF